MRDDARDRGRARRRNRGRARSEEGESAGESDRARAESDNANANAKAKTLNARAFPRAVFAFIRASVQTWGGKHDARDARTDGTMSS